MSMSTKRKQRAQIKKAMEGILRKYRLHKYYSSVSYDTEITNDYSDIERVMHSNISDKTANKAVQIADQKQERERYIKLIELAVERLPKKEKEIISSRYMQRDSEYLTDHNVYCFKLEEEISQRTFDKRRMKGFIKMALFLMPLIPDLELEFDLMEIIV